VGQIGTKAHCQNEGVELLDLMIKNDNDSVCSVGFGCLLKLCLKSLLIESEHRAHEPHFILERTHIISLQTSPPRFEPTTRTVEAPVVNLLDWAM
jgi:hypothetical protein